MQSSNIKYCFLLFFSLVVLVACSEKKGENTKIDSASAQMSGRSSDSLRIISLSAFLTEVIYTMGYGDKIIGRDVTSVYPESVKKIPSLGHISQLNIEAILELQPDLIVVEKNQRNQTEVLDNLEGSGIDILTIPTRNDFYNSVRTAKILAGYFHAPSSAYMKIAEKLKKDSIKLVRVLKKYEARPSVLFLYSLGTGRLMVGGEGTSVNKMIEKAGGEIVIPSIKGFKELSAEILVKAAPEVILLFDFGLKKLNGKSGLASINGMKHTPAFKNDRIISMKAVYLGSFGPRSAEAAIELAKLIHDD